MISYIFLEYCIRQEAKFSHLIKLLLKKHLEKPSSKTYFPLGAISKTSFLTSITAVDTQQMSKINSRLVFKPRYRVDWWSDQKLLNQSA